MHIYFERRPNVIRQNWREPREFRDGTYRAKFRAQDRKGKRLKKCDAVITLL